MACPRYLRRVSRRVRLYTTHTSALLTLSTECDVLEGPPDSIILNLTQHYVFKGSKTPEKEVNSKVTLKLQNGMIEHHEEEWDHKENKDGSHGFMGKLQELRKKADAKMVEMSVSSDPKKV